MRPLGFHRLLASLLALGCAHGATAAPVAPPAAPPRPERPRLATALPSARRTPPPTSPPPLAPVTPVALPALPLAELAEAGPVSLERVGRGGSWLALCRQGAAPHLELVVGVNPSEPIDDLLAWDATGRFVVVRRERAVWLVEVATNVRTNLTELGLDERDDMLDYRQHRALAFDPRGELLAYVRRGARPEVVLRTLSDGRERVAAGVPGEPWRLAWDGTGQALVVTRAGYDPNKSDPPIFPVRLRKGPRLTCSGVLPRFRVAENGEKKAFTLVSRDAASVREAPDLAVPFGSAYISRSADGALILERGLLRQTLVNGDCGARVLHADPTRNVALITCTNDKLKPKRLGLELLGPGFRQELGLIVQSMALDRWLETPARLLPLYPGMESWLLDLDTRKTLALRAGDRVLVTSGTRVLLRRGQALVWLDALSGSETTLLSPIEPFAGLLVEGAVVAVGSVVIDAEVGSILGTVPGRPLALTPSGAALIAEGGAASADSFAKGPLRWHVPGAK